MTDDDAASTNNGPFGIPLQLRLLRFVQWNFSTVFDGAELIPQNFAATSPKVAVSDEGNR